MSIYIHIPFCKTICSYCDFCKMHYHKDFVTKYLIALKDEIKSKYQGEVVDTIYIGGGTPSALDIEDLKILFDAITIFKTSKDIEFTFECNIENIDEEKLLLLYQNKVNRLSIGVQTFNDKYLTFLNRNHNKEMIVNKIELAKKIGFSNMSIDLIYAIPGETITELKNDLDDYLKLGINHVSTYSLIIEKNTKLYIDKVKNIDEDLDFEMYELIKKTLKDAGYDHYETSNFAKPGFESKHNLVYWSNDNYYGFGLGASGYLDNIRYTNTRSINKYIDKEYVLETEVLTKEDEMMYEMILGLRLLKGINKDHFKEKFSQDVYSSFDIKELVKDNKLIDDGINIFINDKYLYVANNILLDFIK